MTVPSSLESILHILGPVLGGLPSVPPHHGGNFFTPITPFFIFYLFLIAALGIKLMKRTASWRQTWIVFLLALCRGVYIGLRWRQGDVRGFAFATELATLFIPAQLMYYSILSLFRDAVFTYQPASWLGKALLKALPRSALLITSMQLAFATPIPAVTWRATATLSIHAARWSHRLNLWNASMGWVTMLLANLAILVAWTSPTANLRYLPGYHYDSRQERAKLFALQIMILTYTIAIAYRGADFFLSAHYQWLHTPGAFYTLFCLPEALCISLHVIMPLKLIIPDPKTLLRYEIPGDTPNVHRDITVVVVETDPIGRRGSSTFSNTLTSTTADEAGTTGAPGRTEQQQQQQHMVEGVGGRRRDEDIRERTF